ncbi:MAG: NAD(P)-binding domain-containing protein, partial [Clostridia bacterium]|nr:NAD(P)-binding domain-containing protein [Clostridia bacterium]
MKYCFIGIGNMASAIIDGMVKNGFAAKDILCFNRTFKKTEDIAQKLGVTPVETIADAVVVSVTPQSFAQVLPEIKRSLAPGQPVISIAAGRDIAYLKEALGQDVPVIRVMP